MASIFTRIIKGEIPSYKILEDDRYFAFLDINPLRKGHTLVIPKVEVDYVFDLDNDTLSGLIVFAKKVASGIRKSFVCDRVGMTVIGLEVPHAHVHLIPINGIMDMEFSQPKLHLTKEEMSDICQRIRTNL